MDRDLFGLDNTFLKELKLLIDVGKVKLPSEQQIKDTLKKVKKLSKTGWLLPNDENSKEHWDFLNNSDDVKKLDRLFNLYFSKKNIINNMLERLESNLKCTKFYDVFHQAIFLYKNNMYSGSTLLLTSIYEGIIRENIDYIDSNNVSANVNGFLNSKYQNNKLIIFQDRESIKIFTEKYFETIDFCNINESNYFNRNVILHGVEYDRIEKKDSLKLLNALDILCTLLIENKNVLRSDEDD